MKPILPLAILLWLLTSACSSDSAPPQPDLPVSISPGWSTQGYRSSPPPEGLPSGAKPVCWKADYSGAGGATAIAWACGYAHGAFDAMQRAAMPANTVKFYKGRYLMIVRWNGGTRTDVTALMRGLELALKE